MTQDRPASGLVRDLRRVLAIVTLCLLALPAYASFSLAQWNVHLANRLRSAGREAPDVGRERFYRGLVLYLPERGAVGFVYRAPHNPDDLARTLYFLQYSLAPRPILETRNSDFVIALDRPDEPAVLDGQSFELVNDFGEGLRLFRRIR